MEVEKNDEELISTGHEVSTMKIQETSTSMKAVAPVETNEPDYTMTTNQVSEVPRKHSGEKESGIMTSETSEESRKRSIEKELVPVLVRIPSDGPSCSSDYIRINKDQFRIGRKPDNDEVILSVWISRIHCILQRDCSGGWQITNLSSTDTLLNDKPIERNNTQTINEGDVLQLSLCDSFKYKFTLVTKGSESLKQPRLEVNCEGVGTVLDKHLSFVKCQENERIDLEKQLTAKQQEQEQLKQELEKLLQDQKVTKTCNEDLSNQIAELQKKIEVGNSTELELQQKYRDLLEKLEEERQKFEQKLAEEKLKWQEELREAKQEKERLEMSMVEQMEEWRERVEKTQQEEWQKKIDNALLEEKNVQSKLLNEKLLLQQKLQEMEKTLKEKEQAQQAQQQAQQQRSVIATTSITHPSNLKKCIILQKMGTPKNICQFPVLETIDLTCGTVTPKTSSKSTKDEAVIDKVNNIMDEQLTCSICSELFVRAMTLNCTHTFCRVCIESWIKRRRDCPNCRAAIVSMTRSLVVDNFIEKMLESLTPEQMQRRKQLIEERTSSITSNKRKVVVKKR